MIAVIDYKAGNLVSVMKALHAVAGGVEVLATEDAGVLARAERIVLPGVGHFAATGRLDETGMTAAVRKAITLSVPFLGICVGMQWLLEGSEESPGQPGLGHFAGRCRRFPAGSEKVPHVGWDTVKPETGMRLFDGVNAGEMFYFTHSYFVPPTTTARVARTRYIEPFAAAVEQENVMGVQFHPEKSGAAGLAVLANFLKVPA